jgi:DNA-binding CsgD family transcriptional regulator
MTGALSARELEVVKLIAGGATNEEIAERLVISPRTVHSHVNRARRKTGARNRTDLAVIAVQAGLLPNREGEGPE